MVGTASYLEELLFLITDCKEKVDGKKFCSICSDERKRSKTKLSEFHIARQVKLGVDSKVMYVFPT